MKDKKYVPEQVAEQLLQYAKNGWQSLFQNGAAMQDAVLADVIELARNSTYAKDHGFDGIKTKEEFLQKVPLSEYGDYVAYIQDNMRQDSQQLTALETEYYLLSTGRSGQGKYYIETKLGALARQLSIDIWNMSLAGQEPVMQDPNVKMLAVTNCSPIEEAPNGKPVRRTSGQAAKVLWERAAQLYVFPYEFLEVAMSEDDRDYLTALYTLRERNFNMLFCNNLAYFGVLLDWIEKKPQQMIQDIKNGYMSVQLSDTDRRILSATFPADPVRAAELQTILDTHGTLPVAEIWPDFIFSGVWLAGSVGHFSRDVVKRLPAGMHYRSEPYGASEAMFSIPMELYRAYGPLAVYSCYFEFMPLDGGEPVSMAEVQDGAYYELVVTTYSGLYRYRLHDIVCVRGFTGTTANIEFCCRSTEAYPLSGRTVYGYELTDLIMQTEQETGCLLKLYQGCVEDDALSVLLEFNNGSCDAHQFCMCLRKNLEKCGIKAGRLYIMRQGYREQLYQSLMTHGRTIQCLKLPLCAEHRPEAQFVAEIR